MQTSLLSNPSFAMVNLAPSMSIKSWNNTEEHARSRVYIFDTTLTGVGYSVERTACLDARSESPGSFPTGFRHFFLKS